MSNLSTRPRPIVWVAHNINNWRTDSLRGTSDTWRMWSIVIVIVTLLHHSIRYQPYKNTNHKTRSCANIEHTTLVEERVVLEVLATPGECRTHNINWRTDSLRGTSDTWRMWSIQHSVWRTVSLEALATPGERGVYYVNLNIVFFVNSAMALSRHLANADHTATIWKTVSVHELATPGECGAYYESLENSQS